MVPFLSSPSPIALATRVFVVSLTRLLCWSMFWAQHISEDTFSRWGRDATSGSGWRPGIILTSYNAWGSPLNLTHLPKSKMSIVLRPRNPGTSEFRVLSFPSGYWPVSLALLYLFFSLALNSQHPICNMHGFLVCLQEMYVSPWGLLVGCFGSLL